ncbi:hypothetical protein [Amycolatopsis sp. NPDC004378]
MNNPKIQVVDLSCDPLARWREPVIAPRPAARFRAAAFRLVDAYLDFPDGIHARIPERAAAAIAEVDVNHYHGVIAAASDLLNTWRSIAVEHGGWDFDPEETYRGTAKVLALGQLSPVREFALAALEAQIATVREPAGSAAPAARTADGDLVENDDLVLGELHMVAAMAAWQGSWTLADQNQLRVTLREQIRLADQTADEKA